MAASSASMAGKKKKLADLSVEEFMSKGFESSSSESEKLTHRSKKKAKNKIKKGKKSDSTSLSSHKKSLDKLREQDPEFYEFLKDEDKSLLEFDSFGDGDTSDNEDVSDEDSESDEDSHDDDEEEEDFDVESSGEDEEEVEDEEDNEEPPKKKKKVERKTEEPSKMKEKSKKSDKELKQLAKKILDDDMSESDEEEMYHQPPEELEIAEEEVDDLDEDIEGRQKRKGKNRVTSVMVKEWTKRFKAVPSPALIHDVIQAFKAAVSQTSSDQVTSKYTVVDSQVFNSVVRMCLVEIPSALQKILDLPATTDLQKPVLPSNSNQKWRKMKRDIKVYLTFVLQLMSSLSQVDMINVLLKHIHKMIAFYACFPKTAKTMLKKATNIWSSGEETSRVLAFLCINRITMVLQDSIMESNIKHMYMAYVKNCKFTSPNTLPLINFMQRSLVEILSINFTLAYQYAFIYIRQLAIHLRNAITIKKKESCQAVYNWQYIHCLGLWVRLLSATHPNSVLEPLIYPLTQTIIGTIKLVPTQRYYPLRFHCVRALTILSKTTNTFIPVLPFLLEVFEQTNFNKKHKSISFKPFNFDCMLKLSKSQLQERAFKDGLIDALYEHLLEQLNAHAHTIGFPELSLPVVLQLKDFLKKCKVGNFCKQIKQILDKVEENNKFINNRRRTVTIALSDLMAISNWEHHCKEAGTPLGNFYNRWRKLRDREMMHKIAARDQIVGDDGLPELKVKAKPQKATEEDKKSFSALFDSDSEDDQDHTDSLLPKKEGQVRNGKGITQNSDSEDDYSDFDDDELEQLARSGDEDDDEDEDIEVETDDDDEEEEENEDNTDGDEDGKHSDDDDDDDAADVVKDFNLSSDED